ncbi:MAG TPA: bifunctional diaminohydroxyphosphoribosylaminopyrimidine deaminase/5-amino-6-(5-phosphoribosylamino)uracil reductase RibD [Bacteroidia bacterium]|nr:bifunctional diaminohydroxyphosphoribosylaminopyrimidine deaminase/5-amino-6-(5-phosphoribosylamino)uracil reductase RibD [Bacteroidia bacterium]
MNHAEYMHRCIEIATNGIGKVSPNPMVGAVIVHNAKIIGEGFHQGFGLAHGEVNAIESVKNKSLLSESTLYVSLEPCNHFGKTPPCTELIVKHRIPKVVIGSLDSNPLVAGKGIKFLNESGIKVVSGILEKECRELNKRFYQFYENKLPYIILKWAQSMDGIIGQHQRPNLSISNELSRLLVHKWRSEESSIMVGTTTALLDNPTLNVRDVSGKNPLRIVLDKDLKLPSSLHLLDGTIPTLVFTYKKNKSTKNLEYIQFPKQVDELQFVLSTLYERKVLSVLIEGGTKLLQSFIKQNLWHEARIFTSNKVLGNGIVAPTLNGNITSTMQLKNDTLVVIKNTNR